MYYGCLKEKLDKRDFKYIPHTTKSQYFPTAYELPILDIKDQGIVNACVAFTLASFLEENYKEENKKFSTGFIYGYRPFGYSQEQGMYPRQALKTLKNVGDVEYKDFEHNKEMMEIKELVDKNIEILKSLAIDYKIESYARIETENEIKNCLMQDTLVPISIPVYTDIELDDNNIIQITNNQISGYHMLLIYGWNELGYLVQNSWGKDWGNNGTAILPYEYEIDSAWAISTYTNNIITYQNIWKKIYSWFLKIINYIKNNILK